jgi:membrane protein YqaA with SNARE-associated domain
MLVNMRHTYGIAIESNQGSVLGGEVTYWLTRSMSSDDQGRGVDETFLGNRGELREGKN